MDAAVASVRVERLDAGELAREAVAWHVVRGRDVVLDVSDAPLVVDADRVRLRQALDNLIANAVAYGGSTRVDVRATRSDETVRIAVSDSGPGIPEAELDGIFELGRRLSDNVPGSGLGLTLAGAILAAHGGTLEVESEAGEGSTFILVLPARGSA